MTEKIGDLTGNKPDVMWEVGYAMARGKPLLLVTQNISEMPFDLKDMQSLEYNRHHLTETLSRPLKKMLLDTLAVQLTPQTPQSDISETTSVPDAPAILTLTHQVRELKESAALQRQASHL